MLLSGLRWPSMTASGPLNGFDLSGGYSQGVLKKHGSLSSVKRNCCLVLEEEEHKNGIERNGRMARWRQEFEY